MTTNVCIIDIDLGLNINAIIEENVIALTKKSQDELDEAIESARNIKLLKENKLEEQKKSEQAMIDALNRIYKLLLEKGDEGLPISEAMRIAAVVKIKTPSSLSLRFKTMLAKNGHQYRLERATRLFTPHYVLVPFNAESESDDEPSPK